jgi:hypothetical protein
MARILPVSLLLQVWEADVRGARDAHLLAVGEGFGKAALELSAVVGLPDQIAARDTVTICHDVAILGARWSALSRADS